MLTELMRLSDTMRLVTLPAAAALLLASACGGSDSNADGGGGSGAGGGAGGNATTSSSSTGGTITQVWQAGFIPETEAGKAPSALSFDNISTGIMSGVLLETTFWQVAPMSALPWQIGRSADVQTDATIGFHDNFDPETPCAFLPVTISGVNQLLPGQAYIFRVMDDGNSYAGEIVEDPNPAPAFVGLRALLSSPLPPSSTVELTIAGETDPVVLNLLMSESSVYSTIEQADLEVTGIVMKSSTGDTWEAATNITLDSAFGYTLYLGFTPPDDLIGTSELVAVE
jgi:hypothetical protein